MTADPVGIKKGMNHLYLYAAGDPVNKVDPMGLEPCAEDHSYKCFKYCDDLGQKVQSCESTFCSGKRLYSICKCYKPKCSKEQPQTKFTPSDPQPHANCFKRCARWPDFLKIPCYLACIAGVASDSSYTP